MPLGKTSPEASIPLTSSPSRLTTPSILRPILIHADKKTLAKCMRTSQTFYDVAAPILYRQISCPDVNVDKLVLGHDQPGTIAQPDGSTTNPKQVLLRYIKDFELGLHDLDDDCAALRHLPRLQIFRIRPRVRCEIDVHEPSALCREDGSTWEDPEPKPWSCSHKLIRADKIILSLYSSLLVPSLLHLVNPVMASSVLTIMVSPDPAGCSSNDADIIRRMLEIPRRDMSKPSLRVIIAPPAGGDFYYNNCGDYDDNVYDEGKPWPNGDHVTKAHLVKFCRELISPKFATTIYLIHGHKYQSEAKWRSHRPLPALKEVEKGVREGMDKSPGKMPLVEFKSRQDYLDEGHIDEIDADELEKWQRLEDEKSGKAGKAKADGAKAKEKEPKKAATKVTKVATVAKVTKAPKAKKAAKATDSAGPSTAQ